MIMGYGFIFVLIYDTAAALQSLATDIYRMVTLGFSRCGSVISAVVGSHDVHNNYSCTAGGQGFNASRRDSSCTIIIIVCFLFWFVFHL